MFLAIVSLHDERATIVELNRIRQRYFWDNDFFQTREKRVNLRDVKLFIFAHYLIWILATIVFIILFFVSIVPKFICEENWLRSVKLIIKVSFHFYILTGYYAGNTHLCFYSHVILHGHFQMNTLMVYLRQQFGRCKKMRFIEKINSRHYQNVVKRVLLRCIKQHQQLTM